MASLVSRDRPVMLPAGAGEDDVKATYTDGILEIRVGMRATQSEPKQIPVTAA